MANVTMSDVARAVGVSRAAVSYVFNGRARDQGISRQLERRILRQAEQMGYRPSLLAQSLAGRRTHILGLILPDLAASYGPALTESLEAAARVNGYQVLLAHHGNDLERFRDALRTMTGWHVDGLAVVPLIGPPQREAIEELEQGATPTVLLERDIVDSRSHVVTCDVATATRMAVGHLLEQGHRRIALLDGPRELLESHVREDAYRQQLRVAGVACDPDLIFVPELSQPTEQQYAETIDRLLDMSDRPTAAVVVSGQRAIALYKACEQRGLSIPGDLSIVAVTGMVFDSFAKLQFTSVRLTYGEVGKAAFELLLQDIEQGRTNPRRVLTSPVWVDGDSTRPMEGSHD